MVHRIPSFAKAISTLAASTSLSPRSTGLAGRLVAKGEGLTGPAKSIAGRVSYSTSAPLAQLGSLGSAPRRLVDKMILKLLSVDKVRKVDSAARKAGIIRPETPDVCSASISAIDSHKVATAIHLTTTPENAREVVTKIFTKSNPENPSSSIFESVIKNQPINTQKIKEQSKATNLAIKKETTELRDIMTEAAKIRGQSRDNQYEATHLISSHLYDPSKGSISRFNAGNLLPIVLGVLYKAGEYDLVVRLMQDTDNAIISEDLPSIQIYVQSLLNSQYTNIHLINATIDHLQEKFGTTAEVLSLKAQFNGILANTAKLTLDIHHHDASKYKNETPEIAEFLKAAEIEHKIVFPDISPKNQADLEAMRNTHENIAITNYLEAYAMSNNPKYGEEAIHIMKGIVLREKMLLENRTAENPKDITKHIEHLENKIDEIQKSIYQLFLARSPHAHYKASVALGILEADLRKNPTELDVPLFKVLRRHS